MSQILHARAIGPYPRALAELEIGEYFFAWRVLNCPICGRRHVHGGGFRYENPTHSLGHRLPHCVGFTSDGYFLVDADPERTAALINRIPPREATAMPARQSEAVG